MPWNTFFTYLAQVAIVVVVVAVLVFVSTAIYAAIRDELRKEKK